MDRAVSVGREPEAAVACSGVEFDPLGIGCRVLGRTPWRMHMGGGIPTSERLYFALMFGLFEDVCTKSRLIGEFAAMTVEVSPSPLGKRTSNLPAGGQIMPPGLTWQHGKGVIADAGDGEPFAGQTKENPRKSGGAVGHVRVGKIDHAAALPSTTSAAISSAVTSSRTANG